VGVRTVGREWEEPGTTGRFKVGPRHQNSGNGGKSAALFKRENNPVYPHRKPGVNGMRGREKNLDHPEPSMTLEREKKSKNNEDGKIMVDMTFWGKGRMGWGGLPRKPGRPREGVSEGGGED